MCAIGFSTRGDQDFRLALCTFSEDAENLYEIVQLNLATNSFELRASFYHEFPANKVIWYPVDNQLEVPDILVTSGENLKIWQVTGNRECRLKGSLVPNSKLSAPLTSFDWNMLAPNILVSASIDTTFTVWDVFKEQLIHKMFASPEEVYDICFSSERDLFAQVSGDGALRSLDLRDLRNSSMLFSTPDGNPLIKLAWNRMDSNYIALIEMDKKYITLVDRRHIGRPCSRLEHHSDYVNAICWAPHTPTHICSVGDDKKALIWDLTNSQELHDNPLLEYSS